MREVGKIQFLPTHLYFFDIASDTNFAKMYKEQHPQVCQRRRQYIKYLLRCGYSSLSVQLSPVAICGYCRLDLLPTCQLSPFSQTHSGFFHHLPKKRL